MEDYKKIQSVNEHQEKLDISDVIVRFLKTKAKELNIAEDRIKIGISYNFNNMSNELIITDDHNIKIDTINTNEL